MQWGFSSMGLGATCEREEPGRGAQNRRRGEQHPIGQGRTSVHPSKNLHWHLGLGLAPGILCQAGAWVSPQRGFPRKKTPGGNCGCPRVFAHAQPHSCARVRGGLRAGKVTGFALGRSVSCVRATAETWSRVLTPAPCFFPQIWEG